MEMRKILYLNSSFYDYIVQLSNFLSVKEEVTLMLPNTVSKEYIDNINRTVNVSMFKYAKHIYYPSIISTISEIIKRINTFKPDIIHFQVPDLVPILLLPRLKKYPLIVTFHDVEPHIGGRHILLSRFMFYCMRSRSKQIIVHGEKLKEQMIKEYNIPEEKVHAIPIGEHEVAPFKIYEKEDIKEAGNLILFFGRIYEYKGLEYLIKAEPMITKEVPDAKIIIAGTGEDFKKYEKMMMNRDKFIVYNYHIPYKEGENYSKDATEYEGKLGDNNIIYSNGGSEVWR